MILAGDIGGTKTLLGLFDERPARPRPVVVREYTTLDFADLCAMVGRFAAEQRDQQHRMCSRSDRRFKRLSEPTVQHLALRRTSDAARRREGNCEPSFILSFYLSAWRCQVLESKRE